MAAILISACTVSQWDVGGWKMVQLVTPSTSDDGDSIDVSTLFGEVAYGLASGATDGTLVCAGTATNRSLLLPGGTDNESRTVFVIGH